MKAQEKSKMMNRKLFIALFISIAALTACQKDIDEFVPDPGQMNGPDTTWYSSVSATAPINDLKNQLMISSHNDSIQVASNTSYITLASGLQCYFPAHSLTTNTGQTLTGSAKIELLHIKTKGDMIRLGKPTTSNGRLLVNGNETFVRAKNDTAELQFVPGVRMTLKYPDQPISTQMKFFVGDESNAAQFNWLPNPDPGANTVGITQAGYEIQTNKLRWTSTCYFYDTTGINRVNVKADLASYFTNNNTVAYVVFRDFRSVVGMYGDVGSKKFSTGKLPVGKLITVVVISKQGNDLFLGYENVTTAVQASTPGEQTVSVKPIKKSLADILAFLNTL